MERPVPEEVVDHAVSLLDHLNLQRQHAQFCDCVVRQNQSPAHLFMAHRCILAASSPVLASLLLSSGPVLELQNPYLSNSVLETLLNFIYTGTVAPLVSQEDFRDLIAAAAYLQMEKLQQVLRDRQCNELNSDNSVIYTNFRYLLRSEKDNHWKSSKGAQKSTQEVSLKTAEETEAVEVWREEEGEEEEVAQESTEEEAAKMGSPTALSRGHEDFQGSLFHSPFTSPAVCSPHHNQGSDRSPCRNSLSLSPPTSGAVPVICHSRRASLPYLRGTRMLSPLSPAAEISSQPSHFKGHPIPCPTSLGGGMHSNHCKDNTEAHYRLQKVDFEDNPEGYRFRIQHSNYSGRYDKEVTDQSEISNHNRKTHEEDSNQQEHRLLQLKDHVFNSGSIQESNNPKHPHENGTLPNEDNKDYSDEKYRNCKVRKIDYNFDKSSTDQRQVECVISKDVSMETTGDETDNLAWLQRSGSGSVGAVLSHAILSSDIDHECHHEVHCLNLGSDGEENEGRGSVSRLCRDEADGVDSHSNQHAAMISGKGSDSVCQSITVARKNTVSRIVRTDRADKWLPTQMSSTALDSFYNDVGRDFKASDEHQAKNTFEHISACEIREPHAPIASLQSNTNHLAHNAEGDSYSGHLHYYCLSQEPTSSYEHHNRRHSHPDCSLHLTSDQRDYSTDWEETESYSSLDHSPIGHHSPNRSRTQLLLLDFSSKLTQSLELHISDTGERALATGVRDGAREGQDTRATIESKADDRGSGDRAEFVAVVRSEAEIKSMTGKEEIAEGRAVTGDMVMECGSKSEQGDNTAVESEVKEGHRRGNFGAVSKVEDITLNASLPVCMPSKVPACIPHMIHHPYQCSMCERSFSQRGSLNRHMRSHLGVRPYPCPQCPMTFSRQYRVAEHMRVHQRSIVDPLLCSPERTMP